MEVRKEICQKGLISVIVPAYNAARYIDSCIDSVWKQTYKKFELLLMDDGSEDATGEICKRWGRKDSRIQYIPLTHGGTSRARNEGIERARGEYVFFLDSDDAIHPGLLEALYRLAEKTGTMITAGSCLDVESKYMYEQLKHVEGAALQNTVGQITAYTYLSGSEALKYFILDKPLGLLYGVRGKLIRKECAASVQFDEGLPNAEDTKYMYQLLADGKEVSVLHARGYYYRGRKDSVSRVLSVKACRSMYTCDVYIRDQEKARGGNFYAVKREEVILGKLSGWHVSGHMKHDRALIHYTSELGKKESRSELALQVGWRIKLECILAFYSYPLYQLCRMLRHVWRRFKDF